MGERSVVYGHICSVDNAATEFNVAALSRFSYDDLYPFRNIFRHEEGSRYKAPSIFMGGTFKQLEEDWPIWLNRLAELLSTLQAVEANVTIDCWFGRFSWTLNPEILAVGGQFDDGPALVGQEWYITSAPEDESEIERYYDTHLKSAMTVRRHLSRQNWPHN